VRNLGALLDGLDLPAADPRVAGDYALPGASLLGGDLPSGHLHVWCGPEGAGKTAFLLGLLHDAARHGRHATLAAYDLSADALALRLLAMSSGVAPASIEVGRLVGAEAAAVARARARLSALPLRVLEARGMSVASLEDRLVRSPERTDVLGVDFLEAVVRPDGRGTAALLQDLADLATRRWIAVVCASRAGVAGRASPPGDVHADRVGWIAPAEGSHSVEVALVENRHGGRIARRYGIDGAARLVDGAPEGVGSR
jgi:hypothetical protein